MQFNVMVVYISWPNSGCFTKAVVFCASGGQTVLCRGKCAVYEIIYSRLELF